MNQEILLQKLKWRYATKKFDPSKKVSESDLLTLLNAANLTATSLGLQPYKMVVVEDTDLKDKLQLASFNQAQISTASHLVVFCARQDVDNKYVHNHIALIEQEREMPEGSLKGFSEMAIQFLSQMNDEQKSDWKARQIYLALGNFLTSCAVLEIDACPMEGILPEKYDEILNLSSENLKTVVVAAIGYRAQDDKYQNLPKVRKSLEEVVLYR